MTKELVYSDITGKNYPLSDAVRILNVKQAFYYIKSNVELYDLYPSNDFKTGKEVLVFIFSKEQSKPYYEEWMKMRFLSDEE